MKDAAAPEVLKTRTVKVPRKLYREFGVEIDQRTDGEEAAPRRYPLSFSSELPVRRWAWDIGEYDEVLSHDYADIDLSRAIDGQLPLLKSHQRLERLGSVREISIDAARKRGRGVAVFSSIEEAQKEETLVREGHLKTVSVGYQTREMTLISKDAETGIPTYRCSWTPFEISTEPVPADWKVGIGRAHGRTDADSADVIEIPVREPPREGERTMSEQAGTTPAATMPPASGTTPTPAAAVPPATGGRDHRAEIQEIFAMARAHNQLDKVDGWIGKGLTPDQVRKELLELVRAGQGPIPSQPGSESLDSMAEKDKRRYSFNRAVRMQVELMSGERTRPDGVEAEVHQELSRHRSGADHGGILVPWRLRNDAAPLTRTMGTTEPTGGATLVGQQVMPEMIDLLRNRALVLIAGAKLYPGLQGTVIFNKKATSPDASWMAENPAAAVTATQPTYGYVSLVPKTLIGQVQIPRQLLVTASIDVEADVRNDLAIAHALALDLAALHGKGADNQPVGIYSAADVQAQTSIGVPELADFTTMLGMLADKNADLGSISWMTTPLLAALLKRTPVVSGQTPMIWEGTFREGSVQGYAARATNQMSKTLGAGSNEHGLIVANWNDLLVGIWGNDLEVVVDVVTRAGYGQVLITTYSMCDVAIRQPYSFVKGTGVTLT